MTTRQVPDAVRDPQRLEVLRRLGLLDSPAEPAFDRLTRLASRILGVPVALVSLVDEDRQFFKSQVGLPEPWASARETPLSHSFCQHVVADGRPLLVADARRDPRVRDNLAVSELGVVAYAGVPLTSSGCVLGAFCGIDGEPRQWGSDEIETLQDLAAAVTTEIELRREVVARRAAERQATRAKECAEAANRSKSQFLTNMSHELRTPLNSVIGFADLLLKNRTGNLTERDLGFLGRVRANGGHLLEMINDVLDLAKIEAGQVELELSSVSLEPLIVTVLAELEGQVGERPLRLLSEVPPDTAPVECDERKLKQILINLIGNAIKFTERGSVTVRVDVDGARRPLAIHVIDTGIGIPHDRHESIFDTFQQADNSTSREYGGTGLGLAIARSLAEQMGYRLFLTSEPGRGSTFTIRLVEPQAPGTDRAG